MCGPRGAKKILGLISSWNFKNLIHIDLEKMELTYLTLTKKCSSIPAVSWSVSSILYWSKVNIGIFQALDGLPYSKFQRHSLDFCTLAWKSWSLSVAAAQHCCKDTLQITCLIRHLCVFFVKKTYSHLRI